MLSSQLEDLQLKVCMHLLQVFLTLPFELQEGSLVLCLCVFESHLLLFIFRFGRRPHSLETPWSSVLTVCRGCHLSRAFQLGIVGRVPNDVILRWRDA